MTNTQLYSPTTSVLNELHHSKLNCWKAYMLLKHVVTPAAKHELEQPVAKLVSHAINLMLSVGQRNQAIELDRAFFTTHDTPSFNKFGPIKLKRSHGESNDLFDTQSLSFGTGLGLNRSPSTRIWSQCLNLHIDKVMSSMNHQIDKQKDFIDTLHQIDSSFNHLHLRHQSDLPRNQLQHMYAHVERVRNLLCRALVKQGYSVIEANEQLSKFLSISSSKQHDDHEQIQMRDMAVIEIMINEIEQSLDSKSDEELEIARTIVERLQRQTNVSIDAFADWVDQQSQSIVNMNQTQSVSSPTRFERLHKQAERLHLAVRLSLLQGQLFRDSNEQTLALVRAVNMYQQSLDLLATCSSGKQFVSLRRRQTSSLIRITRAGFGNGSKAMLNRSRVEMTLEAIRNTVMMLQNYECQQRWLDVPIEAQLVGVLTPSTVQHVIMDLRPRRSTNQDQHRLSSSSSSSSCLRDVHGWHSFDWSLVNNLLDTVALCRRHDSVILSCLKPLTNSIDFSNQINNEPKNPMQTNLTKYNLVNTMIEPLSILKPLLNRKSVILALVRLILLSTSTESFSSINKHGSNLEQEEDYQNNGMKQSTSSSSSETISNRIERLLDWIDLLQIELGRASSSSIATQQLNLILIQNKTKQSRIENQGIDSKEKVETFQDEKLESIVCEKQERKNIDMVDLSLLRCEVIKRKLVVNAIQEVIKQEWGSKANEIWTHQLLNQVQQWLKRHETNRTRARQVFQEG
ncbi:hypothetical protein OIO90_005667 [Microbotryomycetes sp. JL221]|nr:hypothetical protein OIO90_005667 [Microbotryomycetes sp. JL221]